MRHNKILKCFNVTHELTLSNSNYQDFTLQMFRFILETDVGKGDISQCPVSEYQKKIECAIVAKEEGIVAGLEEIEFLLGKNKIKTLSEFEDGDYINVGNVLLKIQGESGKILAMERTILNILQRMCGIATMTAKYKERIQRESCFVIGTRKTLLGFWDKKAVQCGGGLSHRLNLEDAVMLKENHLEVLRKNNFDIREVLETIIRKNPNLRFVEIEVTNEQEFWEMVRNLGNIRFNVEKVIMFDHFTIHQIKNLIYELQIKGLYDDILLEASGDINLNTISQYADAGVDVISAGALTHSVKGLDLSLLFNYKNK